MKARWLNLNRLFGSVRFWFGSARFRFKTGFEPIFYNNVVGKCGRMPRSVIQLSIIAGPPVNTHEALEESQERGPKVLHEANYHKVFLL
jgi:hypothetical protein